MFTTRALDPNAEPGHSFGQKRGYLLDLLELLQVERLRLRKNVGRLSRKRFGNECPFVPCQRLNAGLVNLAHEIKRHAGENPARHGVTKRNF